jgi:hypothetical protein
MYLNGMFFSKLCVYLKKKQTSASAPIIFETIWKKEFE